MKINYDFFSSHSWLVFFGLLAVVVAFFLAILFSGCAQQPVTAPSTAPLQGDLGRAQQHIGQAKTLAQRIHDKDVIIDMWHKQHDH